MNIPIEAVFAMLAIEMYRSLAEPESSTPPAAAFVAAATVGWVLFHYTLAASLARRTRRRLRRAHTSSVEIFEDFRFRQVILRAVLVVLCFVHIHFTRWPTFVEEGLRLPSWSVLDDIAAMAPFVAAMLAGWVAIYRTDRMLSRRAWGLGEYVWFQARYSLLLVLLPWLVLKGIDDSRELWPPRLQEISESVPVAVAIFAALVAAAVVFVPVFLKWLFRARSMPPSEMRSSLEALCRKADFRCRDILVWRMDRARILNAGVMGVIPRYRYVLFSDALLEALSPAECEAVLAHEIGHSKRGHMLVYLVFTLGFVALAYVLLALLPEVFRKQFLFGMPVLATLMLLYFRYLFGYLSRTFERQADVYAAGLIGTPVPLVLALEKIALMSGDIRELGSWRHDSVSRRVRYLSEIGYDGAAQERYHRKVARLVQAVAAAVVLLFALSGWMALREPEGISAEIARKRARAERRRFDYYVWTQLGELEAEAGNYEAAREAFRTALTSNPKSKDALEGLGKLPITEGEKARARAEAYHEAGLIEDAFRTLQALVEAAEPETHVLLARFLMDESSGERLDLDAALEHALKAVGIEEDDGAARAETYATAARVYEKLGRLREAYEFIRKAIDVLQQEEVEPEREKDLRRLLERIIAAREASR